MESVRLRVAARAIVVFPALLLLVTTLSACGDSASSSSSSSSSGVSSSSDEVARSPGSSAPGGPGANGAAVSGDAAATAAAEDEGKAGNFDRKVINTANLGLRARDVREASARVQRLASSSGGSILSSRIERGNGSVSAGLVLLIPAPEFESTLVKLRNLGEEVTTDSVKGRDVTEEFVDLNSRERNLEAAEQSLLRLYDEAGSVEDSLAVQSELTEVRGEIEQIQGRIGYLEQRTASSRIFLDIRPAAGSAPAGPDWDPGGTVAQSWNASLGVLRTLATAAISAIVFSWWLAPAAAAMIVGFSWWRRRGEPAAGASGSSRM